MGRNHRVNVELTSKDRRQVTEILRKEQQLVRLLRRAMILRQLDSGQIAAQVAANVGVTANTVRAIAQRYETRGLKAALYDNPRPGVPRALNAAQSQQIVAMVCSPPPEGRTRWSLRLIAEEAARRKLAPRVSHETVRILLQSHHPQPWRRERLVYGGNR